MGVCRYQIQCFAINSTDTREFIGVWYNKFIYNHFSHIHQFRQIALPTRAIIAYPGFYAVLRDSLNPMCILDFTVNLLVVEPPHLTPLSNHE